MSSYSPILLVQIQIDRPASSVKSVSTKTVSLTTYKNVN